MKLHPDPNPLLAPMTVSDAEAGAALILLVGELRGERDALQREVTFLRGLLGSVGPVPEETA